jgi:3',5'-cyclic AMP phosphodiesterase CpdA
MPRPSLMATSDLHVSHTGNRAVVERIRPAADGDWLIVAGDVADRVADIEWTLRLLAERFERVIWAPGNHELWTVGRDEVQLRGVARYEHLVDLCRRLGVLTPEDPYPVWPGVDEDLVVVPLFLLYDYSWRPAGMTIDQALGYARSIGVVCTDEFLLHPDPYPSRQAWAQDRVRSTQARLEQLPSGRRTVLASHWPLHRAPTSILRWPHFAMWCGTDRTQDWHLRYRAAAAVHGHLHLPMTLSIDGVRFEEVSLGYPREWLARRTQPPSPVRRIVPPDPRRTPLEAGLLKAVGRARRKATLGALAPGPSRAGLATGRVRLRRMLG